MSGKAKTSKGTKGSAGNKAMLVRLKGKKKMVEVTEISEGYYATVKLRDGLPEIYDADDVEDWRYKL